MRGGRAACGLLGSLAFGSCFNGQALWGERCAAADECGPELVCQEDRVCAAERMCEELEVVRDDLRPEVALLLDHSTSMKRCLDDPAERERCAADNPPGPSRWDALGDLVRGVVPEFAERIRFSAVVFPSDTLIEEQGPCNLDGSTAIGFDAPDAATQILAAVPADTERTPFGENPVRAALSGLFPTGTTATLRNRAIVLVTDNPPNCPSKPKSPTDIAEKLDAQVLPLVEQNLADGVLTIVVAFSVVDATAPVKPGDSLIDGTNPHAYFSALAEAGGVPQPGPTPYLHLQDSTALAEVLAGLREQLEALTGDHTHCRVRLATAPYFPELVALELDGRLRRADPDCADDQAWRWLEDDHLALELCPAACEQFDAAKRARIRFGCP